MKLELVSLTGVKYSDEAYEVVIPTAAGEISVYPGHMPLISMAEPGMLQIRKKADDKEMEPYAMLGGVVEIGKDFVRILVDEVEHADEIYEDEARQALERAEVLRGQSKTQVEIAHAQQLIDRHAVRLRVAELRRHGRRRQ